MNRVAALRTDTFRDFDDYASAIEEVDLSIKLPRLDRSLWTMACRQNSSHVSNAVFRRNPLPILFIALVFARATVGQEPSKTPIHPQLAPFRSMVGSHSVKDLRVLGVGTEVTDVSSLNVQLSQDGEAITILYGYRLRRETLPPMSVEVEVEEKLFWNSHKKEIEFESTMKVDGKAPAWPEHPPVAAKEVSDGSWKMYAFPTIMPFEFREGQLVRRTLNAPDADMQISVTLIEEPDAKKQIDSSLQPLQWLVGDWQVLKFREAPTTSDDRTEWTRCEYDGYLSIHPVNDGKALEICYGFTEQYGTLSYQHIVVRELISKAPEDNCFDVSVSVDRVFDSLGRRASIGKPFRLQLRSSDDGELRASHLTSDTPVFTIRKGDGVLRRKGFVELNYGYDGGKFRSWAEGLTAEFKRSN